MKVKKNIVSWLSFGQKGANLWALINLHQMIEPPFLRRSINSAAQKIVAIQDQYETFIAHIAYTILV